MTHILAIDTSTEALSLALSTADGVRTLQRVIPRQHQQQLFLMLDELLDGRRPRDLDLDAIAFGRGPGSFTGLRIAASAAQGLGFSLQLPVVGVSSLETQARSFLRRQGGDEQQWLLSTIDARIGQLYAQAIEVDGEVLRPAGEAIVCAPEALDAAALGIDAAVRCTVIGSGCHLLQALEVAPPLCDGRWYAQVLPEARDMLAPAAALLHAGDPGNPAGALPDYVQKRIGWKTLAEQGKRA